MCLLPPRPCLCKSVNTLPGDAAWLEDEERWPWSHCRQLSDFSGSVSPEQDASYIGDATQKAQDGWSERADGGEGEKEMTSLRKCWAGFKGYTMKEVYSHSSPSLSLSSLSGDVQCRSCSHPYTVNGRGVEYFKLHSPLFPSLLFPSLPFTCLVVH